MIRRPPRSTRTDTLFPYTTLFRSASELANNIFADRSGGFRSGWEELGRSLVAETTDAELQSLKRATQYAHYTPEYIIRAMWDAARKHGFTGGTLLESGYGRGLLLGIWPE